MEISIREITKSDLPKVAELFDLYRQFYEQTPDINRHINLLPIVLIKMNRLF